MSSAPSDERGRTLGFRLAAWYTLVFVASSLVLVALAYVLLASSLRERDREVVESTLARYVVEYRSGGLPALVRAVASDRAAGRYEPLFVRVLGPTEQALFLDMPGAWDFDPGQVPTAGAGGWTTVEAPGRDEALEVGSVRLPGGTLFQVGKSTGPREEILDRFRRRLLLVLLLVVGIGVTGGAAITRAGLRPVRELIAAVRSILETGRMGARVPVRASVDPLDQLSALFNAMLDRIETLVAAMRGSLDNVAHDLRTPMMRLRGRAESALAVEGDEVALRDALAECVEESDRVVSMLDTLMDISEAETGTLRLKRERLALEPLARDATDLYSDLAEEKGVTLQAAIPPGLEVVADPARLRQVLANLIDNAVKATPAGGRVEVSGRGEADATVIEVRDTGVGIAPEEQGRIWERLYRGDQSRTARGLGLGLSLVKAIVEAHGGRVSVQSSPGHGSTFTVRLPL